MLVSPSDPRRPETRLVGAGVVGTQGLLLYLDGGFEGGPRFLGHHRCYYDSYIYRCKHVSLDEQPALGAHVRLAASPTRPIGVVLGSPRGLVLHLADCYLKIHARHLTANSS